MYLDTVLVKLRRDYAKDEVVMFGLNKIREQQVKIGQLKSYIEELESGKCGYKDELLAKEIERSNKLSSELNAVRVENKKLKHGRVNIKSIEKEVKENMREDLKLSEEDKKELLKDKFLNQLNQTIDQVKRQNKIYKKQLEELIWEKNSKL